MDTVTLENIIILLLGSSNVFLWSLHAKVIKLDAKVDRVIKKQEECPFCKSDVSERELERMREATYEHSG